MEQIYTRKILEKLMVVEKDKLYCDLKYPSLHKYLIKELGYSEAEATLRVNVVRLMNKSKEAKVKVLTGKISLVNASEANKASQLLKDEGKTRKLIEVAESTSTREFKKIVDKELGRRRREVLVLEEYMIEKFDRARKKHGDQSTLELIDMMLEKELRAPGALQRDRSLKTKHSRNIAKSVKVAVYTGKCANCGVKTNLEYDHKVKFSHGGRSVASNMQMLCRNCNQRKEIVARQMGMFV